MYIPHHRAEDAQADRPPMMEIEMSSWKKITPAKIGGSRPAETYRVRRNPSVPKTAYFALPAQAKAMGRCSVYQNGSRLGFRFAKEGEYKAKLDGRTTLVCIPAQFVAGIPFGTTEVSVSLDGGMFVIDLDTIARPALAAE